MTTPDLFPGFDSSSAASILASAHQATRAGQSVQRHHNALALLWPGEFTTPANLERRLRRVQDDHRRQRDHRTSLLNLTPVTLSEAQPGERLLVAFLGLTTEAIQIVPNLPEHADKLKNCAAQLYRFTR
jgi:hypothetical protein